MIEKISRAFKTSKREEITRTTTPPLPPNRVVKIFSEKRNGENGQSGKDLLNGEIIGSLTCP